MSISHWGMFFGFMESAAADPYMPGVYIARWRACSPEEWVFWQ